MTGSTSVKNQIAATWNIRPPLGNPPKRQTLERRSEKGIAILGSDQDLGDWIEHYQLLPRNLALPIMLEWYRSRDIEKVTTATHWFVSIDIQARLKSLVEDLRNGNLQEVENAKRTLTAFSELGLKTVVSLLDDPELHRTAEEILSEMDEFVLPHLLRWIERSDSYNIRIGIYRALVGRLCDPRAKRALADGLRSPDTLEAAFVCQALLEKGPKGRRIIEIVFPEAQLQVA